MSTPLRNLIIRLSTDTATYQAEMARAGRVGNDYYKTMESGSRRYNAVIGQNQASMRRLSDQMNVLQSGALRLAAAFAGTFAVSGAIDAADNWGQMAARVTAAIQSVEGSADKYDQVQQRLLSVSNRNAKAIEDSQELYIASAKSMQELGYSTNQTLDFIESLSSSYTRNATSGQKVQSSIDAINKSMVTGRMTALQWNTIAAATPTIVSNIAAAMGTTEQEVKRLAMSGKMSMSTFVDAVIQAKDTNNEFADAMDNTVRDGFTQITNSLKAYVGELNRSEGITRTAAAGLKYIAQNIETVVNAGVALAGVGLARYVGTLTTNTAAATVASAKLAVQTHIKAQAQRDAAAATLQTITAEKQFAVTAQQALTVELKRAQTQQARIAILNQLKANAAQIIALDRQEIATKTELIAVQQRLNVASNLARGALGLIGGPMGAAMLAGSAIYYFFQKSEEARREVLAFADALPKLTAQLGTMTDAAIGGARHQGKEYLNAILAEIEEQKKVVDAAAYRVTTGEKLITERGEQARGTQSVIKLEEALTNARGKLAVETAILEEKQKKLAEAQKQLSVVNSDGAVMVSRMKSALSEMLKTRSDMDGLTTSFEGLDKALAASALQLDVAGLKSQGMGREAYILSGLQQVAGDAALEHRDALIELSKGQLTVSGMSDELIAKLQTQADALGKLFDSNNKSGGRSGGGVSAVKQTAQAFERQAASMKQQIALYGQTTELAKLKYQLSEGELKKLTSSQKIELERYAVELDRLNAHQKYKALMESLLTSEEKLKQTTTDRVKILQDANLSAEEYKKALDKIAQDGIKQAPGLDGIPSDFGMLSDFINVSGAEEELQKWHDTQIEMQNTLFNQLEADEQSHKDRLTAINETYFEKQRTIQLGYASAAAGVFESIAGSAADMAKTIAGENSGAYKALFVAQKAFAASMIIINAQIAAAKAPAEMTVLGGIAVGKVLLAAGYANAGMVMGMSLAGMAHDGIDDIPREGTWLLDKGERVVDSRTNSDLKNYLSSQNYSANRVATGDVSSNDKPIIINNYGNDEVSVRQMDDKTIIDIAAKRGAQMAEQNTVKQIRAHSGAQWDAFSETTNLSGQTR